MTRAGTHQPHDQSPFEGRASVAFVLGGLRTSRAVPGWLTALLLFVVPAAVTGETLSPDGVEFFEKRIRPVLVARCYECHSAEGGKSKGGLRVDSRDALRRGGDTRPAIVPGDLEKSLLLEAIRYRNQNLQMPPKGRLPDPVIADFEAWIRMNAPDPRVESGGPIVSAPSGAVARATQHWAFVPPRGVTPPEIKRSRWARSPIDAFILSRLKAVKLSPAPPADKATLLRRVTFDLIGLPPAPEEIDAFLADSSPEAFPRVVDRLLASPHYGERWGRHWLDVARYADSNGQDENKAMSNAWRYRDYVIRAFNQDKPFDQFIREQLAGDLLPSTTDERENFERWTATGFLVLGPKMLAEQDKPKLVMDIVDEQIDVVSRAFLGLTVSCSRCHDHKFDPVPARDYYAMAGIFKSTKTMADLAFVSKWNERTVATRQELEHFEAHRRRTNELSRALTEAIREADQSVRQGWRARAGDFLIAAMELTPVPGRVAESNRVEATASKMSLHRPTLERWVEQVAQARTNSASALHRFLSTAAGAADLARTVQRLSIQQTNWSFEPGTDEERADLAQAGLRQLLFGEGGLLLPPKEARPFYSPADTARIAMLENERAALNTNAPPAPAMALAVEEAPAVDLPVHIRGSHLNLAKDLVPRGFVQVLSRKPTPPVPPGQSGRLQLAEWLTDLEHPLTARVAVNRIWQAHFGEGLVRTPDNFGLRGEAPTHPELLDWLARDFVRHGWSVKQLHRRILLSSSYQMSTRFNEKAARIDPDNRLLWRMNRRRLEAEPLRDALLAASGQLDRTMGGSLVSWSNADYTPPDTVSAAARRRAVYLPVVRDRVYDVFTIFDFANPSVGTGKRTPTVVSHQALFFMNSPFVKEQARALAVSLLSEKQLEDADRVKAAYRTVFGRAPQADEVTRALGFLTKARVAFPAEAKDPVKDAWASLCQALLASNEFLYLD